MREALGICAATALLWVACDQSTTEPESVLTNIRLSNDVFFTQQEEPFLAVDQAGRIYAGWKEMNSPGGVQRVAFSRSMDDGETWSSPILMDRIDPNRGQSDPWLVVDRSGKVYYAHYAASGIVVATSTDRGETWSEPINVHDGTGWADKESLATDGDGTVYISYHHVVADTVAEVRVARTQDGGVTWSTPVLIPHTASGRNFAPVLAAKPGGTVHAVSWSATDENIVTARSSDYGTSWGAPMVLNEVAGSVPFIVPAGGIVSEPPFPSATISSTGELCVAWPDMGAGDWDVVATCSSDDGVSWANPVRVSGTNMADQWMISLASDEGGVIHAAWYDASTEDTRLMYAHSEDHGRTWSPDLEITTERTPGRGHRLGDYIGLAIVDGDVPVFAWTDIRDGLQMDIYFARGLRH